MPIPKKYRFFFEVPFDENAKEPESYTRDFFEKGDLKLFKDGEKVGVDGFFGCCKCAFHELAEFIGGKGILAIYGDTEYMLSHKEESYYVKNIYRAQSACKMEEKTYITKPLYDIEASLIKYNDRVNKAERVLNGYSGNGSRTNEELWVRGKMDFNMHNYLSEQRGKWVDEHRRELELHNASAEKSVTYVSGVQTLLYTAGYAIYNEDDRMVFLCLKRAPGIGRAFTYLLPQKMEFTSFTANEDEFFRRPKGKVIDLEAGYDSGTNKFFLWQAMKYLVENYSAELPRVGALDQCPVDMTDDEWRMWVLISHNHHRVDFP